MENSSNLQNAAQTKELSFTEILSIIQKYYKFLLSKWKVIALFVITGGLIGLVASFLIKPTYTAKLSFALLERSKGGGLADLASSFGFSGLSGGESSAFSGDNLLEIIQSRYSIEQTLLTPVIYKGKKTNLVEVYIDFSNLRADWESNSRHSELLNLQFPVGQKRELFTRTQDSVLFSVYDNIVKSHALSVIRKDKKTSIVNVEFSSKNEFFSKLFLEELMSQTYLFYQQTKTAQSRANIDKMQHTADSIKILYESALSKGAGFSTVNINAAMQYAAVPRVKQQNNAELYGKVYAEVLKNLETLRLDMARETPIVQIIDTPRYPLSVNKFGKIKAMLSGSIILSGILVLLLCLKLTIKEFFVN